MNRKDFIKKISIFTISIPFLTSCEVESGEKKEIIPGPYKIIGDLCVNCLKCFAVCPELDRDTIVQNINTVKINEAKCIECGECYSICPYDAIVKEY
jgi:ferredoxin